MADGTKIEWADATLNYINGCTRISPGCGQGSKGGCYAERLAATRLRNHPAREGLAEMTSSGPHWTGQIGYHEPHLLQALRWKAPRRIFWNAHGDTFHANVSDEAIDRLFAVCALTPQHVHLILTKRADRMADFCDRKTSARGAGSVADQIAAVGGSAGAQVAFMERMAEFSCLSNVWLGVSVEDQQRADERRDDFRETPAAVKFVSYEPALGPVDWSGWDFVDQIIGGGESGPRARPAHPDWFRDTRDWCCIHRVAYFHKQNGEFASVSEVEGPGAHFTFPDGATVRRVGKKAAGRLLDGVEHNGMPEARHG
mgnify:CR=1 FL=1